MYTPLSILAAMANKVIGSAGVRRVYTQRSWTNMTAFVVLVLNIRNY